MRRRKTAQFAKEVYRAVSHALDGDVFDPILDSTFLEDAIPLDHGGFQLVFVTSGDRADVRAALEALLPIFKEAVARRSSRKRVPQLFVDVLPDTAWEVDNG